MAKIPFLCFQVTDCSSKDMVAWCINGYDQKHIKTKKYTLTINIYPGNLMCKISHNRCVDIYPKVKVSITNYTQASIGLVKYLTMELSKLITKLLHMHYPRPITWGKIISLLCRF